ncbi:MAG: ferredoxin:thioredoxin reductase [Elusimicrobia bacterium GWA2_56_46]|jgi:ferredoxin-thioredoxin reductase catalytic subunit|nr:MAG: ferredoxin:thioredoxin reductase [Elusimicrobia bacterium GWA2_56_46]OGR55887.1 MAG: ferredoxin:thioredoxin reductase [Elusimicrobia bacterium GWC2_56_31]HBB67542.1 ferredoxin:thioredoxin reductase [Elusimicrobiota bacterium]HBW22178.1 ferredoxin:thioredoxin reductase [Elusimicrobiota bacterium]
MNVEAGKKALRFQFAPIVDKLGYKFNPAEEDVEFLLEAEVTFQRQYGIPYCPCQARTRDRAENMKIVCPCIPFHREHYDAMKRCWCGLFVHKDVTDPSALKQIPPSKFVKRKE